MEPFEIIISAAVVALTLLFVYFVCSLIKLAEKLTQALENLTRTIVNLHERVLNLEASERQDD